MVVRVLRLWSPEIEAVVDHHKALVSAGSKPRYGALTPVTFLKVRQKQMGKASSPWLWSWYLKLQRTLVD